MKKYVKPIYAGISGKFNKEKGKFDFKVDFDDNSDDDVIKFIEPFFQKSKIDDNTYWFGYSFNDGQSNPRRDEFIEFIKHVQPEKLVDPEDEWSGFDYDDEHLTETDLDFMICRSLDRIRLNNYSVDTIVYPESKSGNLVSMIVRCITRVIYRARDVKVTEIKKADPNDAIFNYDKFHRDLDSRKIDIPDFVDDEYIDKMMQKVRSAPSFSLRKYIKPSMLRNYVSNFYNLETGVSAIASSEVVLVVDDFGTTGTTIREIVRNIREINTTCEIYIFTLMGNKRTK